MLIALAGHAGSGKTTAIEFLRKTCRCGVVYLGDAVLEEVKRRRLEPGAGNERIVRAELREREGHDAFARRSADRVVEILTRADVVFVDAIYHLREFEFLAAHVSPVPAHLLAIEASLETRIARLAVRPARPIVREELAKRDQFEREKLGTGAVIAQAMKVGNDGSLEQFQCALSAFINGCAP